VMLIYNALVIVVGPAMASLVAQNDIPALVRLYKKASRGLALLTLFFGGGVLLFRKEVLALFGAEYQSGETLLVILLIGAMVAGFSGLNSPILLAAGRSDLEFAFSSIAFLLMLFLGLILGSNLGANGVAFATTCAGIFLALARRWAGYKLIGPGYWVE
jgi:O-antigen/teichoic acid export membrane protein